jgi:exodeoxyribonuclease VII large subunit
MPVAENLINAPEFTVSELSSALKRTVEDAYGHVRVRGEISGFRGPHSSGHCYFALKDESAKIEAVIWKAPGGARGHRHWQAHDLSGLIEIPDRHRGD